IARLTLKVYWKAKSSRESQRETVVATPAPLFLDRRPITSSVAACAARQGARRSAGPGIAGSAPRRGPPDAAPAGDWPVAPPEVTPVTLPPAPAASAAGSAP